jgi:hypothetical protein
MMFIVLPLSAFESNVQTDRLRKWHRHLGKISRNQTVSPSRLLKLRGALVCCDYHRAGQSANHGTADNPGNEKPDCYRMIRSDARLLSASHPFLITTTLPS